MKVVRSRSRDWVEDIGRRAQSCFSVCCHGYLCQTGKGVADLLESPLVELGAKSGLRRCVVCLTEYSFFVWQDNCKGSIHVVLSTWITFGSCAHSFSPAWLASSLLTNNPTRLLNESRVPEPARTFQCDSSPYYTGSAISRAIELKNETIVRPSDMIHRLSPSRFDEPEEMCGWTQTDLTINTTDGERSQSIRCWQKWWQRWSQRGQKWRRWLKVSEHRSRS